MRPYIIFCCIFFAMNLAAQDKKSFRYVSLGDSYTIGTGAKTEEAWPVLLTKHLNAKSKDVKLVANPARNGYSTQNLIDYELPVLDTAKADLVTILIGVNDWVRGVDKETFTGNLDIIIESSQARISNKNNIVLITIPDFGVTPQGALYSKGRDISKGISEFNTVIKNAAKKYKLPLVDIFELSKKMKNDPSLVAKDELHPSAKEYAAWEAIIYPVVYKLMSAKEKAPAK